MRAVVIAAGEGKRMRPLTANRPKCMLPVGGVPVLERLLLALSENDVTQVSLVVGYKEQAVRQRFGTGSRLGVRLRYVRQARQLGTGDAVRAAGPFREETLVVNGDLLVSPDAIARVARTEGSALAARSVTDARAYGALRLRGRKLLAIEEKSPRPSSRLANAGIYKLSPEVLLHLSPLKKSPRGEYELTSAINAAVRAGEAVHVVEIPEPWLDLGRPWDLLAANEAILEGLKDRVAGVIEEGAHVKGPVVVGKGTILRSGSYVVGPVVIGESCDIGPNCFLRAKTVIGNGCRVGNAVEIKNSLLMDGAHVGHLSYVGDSVIGERANLGAGTITANLRHDGKTIVAKYRGEKIDTGRRKFGCVLGDDVHTGIGTRLNVGAVLDPGATTKPGAVVM